MKRISLAPWVLLALLALGAGAAEERPPIFLAGDRPSPNPWVSVMPPGAARPLTVGVDSAGMLYVATNLGVFRSPDGGATWLSPTDPIEAFQGNHRLHI